MNRFVLNITEIQLNQAGAGGFVLLFLIVLGITLLVSPSLKDAFKDGVHPKSIYRRIHRKKTLDVYERLGGEMIRMDVADMAPQLRYMRSYLRRLFPDLELTSSRDIYNTRFYEDEQGALLYWVRRKLSYPDKIQLLDYLIDLGFHNHAFTKREVEYLRLISGSIGIPISETKAMMRIRYEQLKKAEEARREQQRTQHHAIRRPNSAKMTALKVLGLDAKASLEDIRKAYRQLARVHHPDRFARGNEEEKRLAHERFTEISKAHDYLISIQN
jgi:hypothetical protein